MQPIADLLYLIYTHTHESPIQFVFLHLGLGLGYGSSWNKKISFLFISVFYILYLNIRMQVVIQVFFMALCNNMDQHSVHTGKPLMISGLGHICN